MRTLIENYRGFEIYFDSEREDFYTLSEMYDTQQTKKSYSATKKYIDTYLKDNQKFIPFFAEKLRYSDIEQIQIIGIRKDGDFTYLNKNGDKLRLSSYDEKDYYLINKENEPIYKEISEIEEKIKELEVKDRELRSKIIKVNLKAIKSNYVI